MAYAYERRSKGPTFSLLHSFRLLLYAHSGSKEYVIVDTAAQPERRNGKGAFSIK